MGDDLKLFKNGRQPQCFRNGRLPQFFQKWKMILNFIKMKDDLIFPSRTLKSSSSDSGGYVKEGVHQKIKNFNQLQFCLHNQPLGLLAPKTFPFSAG